MTIKEKLHTLVDQLDDAQTAAALAFLDRLGAGSASAEASLINAPRSGPPVMPGHAFHARPPLDLPTLAASQGVYPVTNFGDLLGDFWPEDETADQFGAGALGVTAQLGTRSPGANGGFSKPVRRRAG